MLIRLLPYIKIARFDHYIKQLFILPGFVAAIVLCGKGAGLFNVNLFTNLVLGLLSTCFITSANYVLNEFLDAPFDKFHPIKRTRSLVGSKINVTWILFEYVIFVILGLIGGILISDYIFLLFILLLVSGVLYNVQPIRCKDIPYIDVISESFNMMLRLLIGWFLVTEHYLPPISLVLGYWLTGAYLMATKRFSEFKMIGNKKTAANYRKSFAYYTEERLIIQAFFYAIASVFFIGIFMIKYRIELLLDIPLLCILYCYYFQLSFSKESSTQAPEKLFTERFLMLFIFIICVFALLLMFTHIPALHLLTDNILIQV